MSGGSFYYLCYDLESEDFNEGWDQKASSMCIWLDTMSQQPDKSECADMAKVIRARVDEAQAILKEAEAKAHALVLPLVDLTHDIEWWASFDRNYEDVLPTWQAFKDKGDV